MNEVVNQQGITGADKAKLWAAILIVAAGVAAF